MRAMVEGGQQTATIEVVCQMQRNMAMKVRSQHLTTLYIRPAFSAFRFLNYELAYYCIFKTGSSVTDKCLIRSRPISDEIILQNDVILFIIMIAYYCLAAVDSDTALVNDLESP